MFTDAGGKNSTLKSYWLTAAQNVSSDWKGKCCLNCVSCVYILFLKEKQVLKHVYFTLVVLLAI